MKTPLKAIAYILTLVALFLAGVGIRLAQHQPATAELHTLPQEFVAEAKGLNPTVSPTDVKFPDVTGQPSKPVDLTQDLQRGSFLSSDSIQPFREPDQEQTVDTASVSISTITRQDTRAFVNLCMEIKGNREKLDFGTLYVDFPGGRSENFFVHKAEGSHPGQSCLTLEFVSIPVGAPSSDWKVTMEWLAYAVPDEGTECSAYLRRAEASKLLQQQGIEFTCDSSTGQADFQITNKPDSLTEVQAAEIVNQAVTGIFPGPWVFVPVMD